LTTTVIVPQPVYPPSRQHVTSRLFNPQVPTMSPAVQEQHVILCGGEFLLIRPSACASVEADGLGRRVLGGVLGGVAHTASTNNRPLQARNARAIVINDALNDPLYVPPV